MCQISSSFVLFFSFQQTRKEEKEQTESQFELVVVEFLVELLLGVVLVLVLGKLVLRQLFLGELGFGFGEEEKVEEEKQGQKIGPGGTTKKRRRGRGRMHASMINREMRRKFAHVLTFSTFSRLQVDWNGAPEIRRETLETRPFPLQDSNDWLVCSLLFLVRLCHLQS